MYAVANCDSALWGTRSVGNVSVIVKDSASTDALKNGMHVFTRSTLASLSNAPRGEISPKACSSIGGIPDSDANEAVEPANNIPDLLDQSNPAPDSVGTKATSKFPHRTRKFVILILWLLANVGVTVVFLFWHLTYVAVIGIFGRFVVLMILTVVSWTEFRRQKRLALSPISGTNK